MWRLPLFTVASAALVVWLIRVWRRWWARTLVVTVALVLAVPLAFFWWLEIHDLHMKLRVRDISARLETYRTAHGEYPATLREIGVEAELDSAIFYERSFDPLAYHLSFEYFPHSLATYDSDKKSWEYY